MLCSNYDAIFAPINSVYGSSVVVFRVSGSKNTISNVLQKLQVSSQLLHATSKYVNIYKDSKVLDSCIITNFKAPKSFTGEEVIEISIHASQYIYQSLTELLLSVEGVRYAKAGEFLYRAFLNNKLDLIEAQGVNNLILSTTELEHKMAIEELTGNASKHYKAWKESIIEISSLLECYIDFAEDEQIDDNFQSQIQQKLQLLVKEMVRSIENSKNIIKAKSGIEVCIFGKPNAGKSSLINKILGEDFAIVSEIAGTTRDVLEAKTVIGGVSVSFFDTAGIRQNASDKIEEEGIKRAKRKIESSDIKILIIDQSIDFLYIDTEDDIDQYLTQETIILLNKCDATQQNAQKLKQKYISCNQNCIFEVSLLTGYGFDQFKQYLETYIRQNFSFKASSNIITGQRELSAIGQVVDVLTESLSYGEYNLESNIELFAENLRLAITKIESILGKIDKEEILDKIFSSFCIGK